MTSAPIQLRGITWGHSRGFTPLVAAAQRFHELYPDVQINWSTRSLQAFADFPLEQLVNDFDLLVIDHPWVGRAAALSDAVLPLDQHLPYAFWQDQQANSVGASHASYQFDGHQWAIAIDAATPVASCRADLLAYHDVRLPQTWTDLMTLARQGRVAIPAIPIDLLMNFYTFCIAHGGRPFTDERMVIDRPTGLRALDTMQELYSGIDRSFFNANPIAIAERMTQTDEYWYCPFAYGYSNYARIGYARQPLTYADVVSFDATSPLRTTLGGTGLAVSAHSKQPGPALAYAHWLGSAIVQQTFYVQHGGQPGHRAAWTNEAANELTNQYFSRTLPALERAYVRPRYNGYLHFQDHAGLPLQLFLRDGGNANAVLNALDKLYRQSQSMSTPNSLPSVL